jgi:DNA polymerase-3 subunit epsilon
MDKIILNENTLILDTETTGLDSKAEICEITIIDSNGKPLINTLVKPINPIPEEAIKIHGITNEMVANSPTFIEIEDEIFNILYNKKIVIYNADYDIRLLMQCANDAKAFDTFRASSICVMKWYQQFTESTKWIKLTKACEHMKIDISDILAHRALADCNMTLRLIKTVNSKLDFMHSGMIVKYVGNEPTNYGKTGVFQRMIFGTTVAKINIDGILMACDISNLISFKEEDSQIIMTNQPEIINNTYQLNTEITFDIVFKQPEITFDENKFKESINQVIMPIKELGTNLTKEILTDTLAKLRKFQKEISDRRIAIVKEIKAPITDLENKIKKGDAEIENYISKYDAELKKIEAIAKAAKGVKIDELLKQASIKFMLNSKYAGLLVCSDEYFLQKWTLEKIKIDIDNRAEALFKQQDYERIQSELKNTQIESRTRLIEHLNNNYMTSYTYANYPIEKFTDYEVAADYIKKDMENREKLAKKAQADMEIIKNNYEVTDKSEAVVKVTQSLEQVEKPQLIFQNLRLGAEKQNLIIQAVAKLKANGLSVEFI